MAHPALENMDYKELTALIDEATKLRATKFEADPKELEEKMRRQENTIEAERLAGAVPPNVN
jgi:hypothetical protein